MVTVHKVVNRKYKIDPKYLLFAILAQKKLEILVDADYSLF